MIYTDVVYASPEKRPRSGVGRKVPLYFGVPSCRWGLGWEQASWTPGMTLGRWAMDKPPEERAGFLALRSKMLV